MSYALVELSTGNVVGFFATEPEALEEVLDSIERYGRGSVETLALGFNDPDGPVQEIVQGARLADRALAVPIQPRLLQ